MANTKSFFMPHAQILFYSIITVDYTMFFLPKFKTMVIYYSLGRLQISSQDLLTYYYYYY